MLLLKEAEEGQFTLGPRIADAVTVSLASLSRVKRMVKVLAEPSPGSLNEPSIV